MYGSATLANIIKSDPDWKERQKAARYLGRDRSEEAEEALLAAIDDEDDDVSHAAVLSLVRLSSSRLLDIIIKPKILYSGNESIRWAAGYALGALGNTVHIKYLCELVNDTDWCVRDEALTGLERLMSKVGEGPDEGRLTENILLLILMFRINNFKLQRKIIETLARLRHFSYKPLVDSLCAADENIKTGVVKTLGEIGNMNSVPELVPLLNHESSSVRKAAAEALGKIGGSAAINAIVGRFGDGSREVAEAAVNSVISLENDDATALILVEYLRNTYDTAIKRNIFFCMGEIRHPSMIKPMLDSLGSSYFTIRSSAAFALAKFGEEVRDELVGFIGRSEISIDPLLKAIDDPGNARDRIRAINALGQLERTEARGVIEKLVQHDEGDIANAAEKALSRLIEVMWARAGGAFVLGEIGGNRSVPVLLDLLKDRNTEVRFAAVSAFCKIKDQSTAEIIASTAVHDPSSDVRSRAVRALGEIGLFSPGIRSVLIGSASDESHDVRSEAVRVLGKIAGDDVAGVLVEALNDKVYKVRKYAIDSLYNIGEEIIPKLFDTLGRSAEKAVITGIFSLLAMLNVQESVPMLKKLMEDETDADIKNMAGRVIQAIKPERGEKDLAFLLES